ncbi:MAG: hypothetical protein Q7T20_16945 [Saprospiraceae bacterium]|nr:hypothetical protein [Saprospiraceae bacterium]
MTLKHLVLSLLLASLAFVACKKDGDPTPEPPLATHAILPGVGIKEVKLGDAVQTAIDFFGTPFPINSSVNGVYTHYIIYTSKGATVYCEPTTNATFDPQMKLDRIRLSAPFDGKTVKNIGIGSSKTDVKVAYGDPTSSHQTNGDKYAIGITFIYDNAEKVKNIDLEKP